MDLTLYDNLITEYLVLIILHFSFPLQKALYTCVYLIRTNFLFRFSALKDLYIFFLQDYGTPPPPPPEEPMETVETVGNVETVETVGAVGNVNAVRTHESVESSVRADQHHHVVPSSSLPSVNESTPLNTPTPPLPILKAIQQQQQPQLNLTQSLPSLQPSLPHLQASLPSLQAVESRDEVQLENIDAKMGKF